MGLTGGSSSNDAGALMAYAVLKDDFTKQSGEISKKIEKDLDDLEKELRIKLGSAKDLIGSLSGGNQQKVVLAKWLDANP